MEIKVGVLCWILCTSMEYCAHFHAYDRPVECSPGFCESRQSTLAHLTHLQLPCSRVPCSTCVFSGSAKVSSQGVQKCAPGKRHSRQASLLSGVVTGRCTLPPPAPQLSDTHPSATQQHWGVWFSKEYREVRHSHPAILSFWLKLCINYLCARACVCVFLK